ncbi:MAG: hypothetical protein ACYTEK_10780 [Planctomycetota bacterium]
MKPSCLKASWILLSVVLGLGLVLSGCKKEAPPPEEPGAPPVSTEEQAAKEKEFLSDPDVVTCELESTTISKLDFPKDRLPSFVRRMERQSKEVLKQGTITLAGRPFKVLLGERPEREFYLYDVEKKFGPYWWGSWSLHSYHKIDDTFYEFTTVDAGSKIAARPYKGELGVIKVGTGGRELEKIEFNGSVHQQGNASVPIGTIEQYWTGAAPECEIPVGDYTSHIMDVTYDNLSIEISNNYHTNAQGLRSGTDVVYGMKVRKDKPYVLDFSNEPMVVFDQPPTSQTTFSRGDEIAFAAVLVDPKLDIMIRGLDDTSVKVDKEYKDRDGKVIHTAKVNKPLDPNVVVVRADGEVVAEGVMPFG